jgi:hypothetical protein
MGPEIRSTNRCLLILSNEEKLMIMKILKRGEEDTKSMPHAPVTKSTEIQQISNLN